MTNREFYVAITNVPALSDELREFAADALTKLDARNKTANAKRAERTAARAVEREPLRAALAAALDESTPKTATMLVEDAGVEVAASAVPSLLKPLVDAGEVAKTKLKVEGRYLVAYLRATADASEG